MKISLVIPCFNEADIISSVIGDLENSLKKYGFEETEIIFVDDGSKDNTADIIRSSSVPNLRLIPTGHLGLSHALFTGIKEATGDIIVTIDADGQFSFDDVPRFIETLIKNDADIVTGYRIKRNDNPVRVISSKFANFVKRVILKDDIYDSTCTLKAFRREVRERILYGFDGFHRFIPSFALMNNLKLIQIPVEHRDRRGGKAKFGIINRLPDVIPDVLGVRWLQYKRFSTDADERRYSFYPDLLFLLLFLYVASGLFGGYFRVVDDFWLYGSLNRFIGYDYSKSYGWENFVFNEIVPPLIRLFYAVVMNLGRLLGVKYPLEWANKVIGISVTFSSYFLFGRFFNLFFRRNYAKWISLLIVFWGISSSEIYSGLARSFSYILIPFLLIFSRNLSVIGLSVISFLTALIYPVLLPLFFLTILLTYLFGNIKSIYKSAVPVISGLAGLLPMVYKINLMSFSPATEGDTFLGKNNIFNLHISSDFGLLFGFTKDIGFIEWINFNFLHQWILNDELTAIIRLSLIVFLLSGIFRRLSGNSKSHVDIFVFLFTVLFFLLALHRREYVDLSYLFKWGLLLSAVYTVAGIVKTDDLRRYKTVFVFALSSLVAFFITHVLSRKFGFGVHEPGRQLQRAFAVIFPFAASVFYFNVYKSTGGYKRALVIVLICLTGILFFPKLKLVSPNDKYVIERLQGLPKGSLVLSHPLTANWVVSHTDKYSTIIDEQIRATKKNPIRGSEERIMPTEMTAIVLEIYYGKNLEKVYDWCSSNQNGYILVEEYYYSDQFFNTRREPYISFVERQNPERSFPLLGIPLSLRHPVTPETFLLSCKELTIR